MNFHDRQDELAQLEQAYDSAGSALVVLYGRRRLGKTALLRQFAATRPHCYFMADRAAEADLRRSLATTMAEALGEETLAKAEYTDWYDLFAAFDRLRPARRKFALILDEYQYLCQVQPAFSSFLQKWWDEHWSGSGLCLILCGSATSMMYKQTLASSAPLYGRATAQLLLRPIRVDALPAFLPGKSPSQLVEFATMTGGVPRYLELAAPFRSRRKALIELVLRPNGILHNEARQLLQEEIQSPNICWSILHAIGSGATRVSEIGSRLQEPANKLTRYLDLLRDLCLIRRETPVLESKPATSKKGTYLVSDAFTRLWFGVVYPYNSFFEFGDIETAYPRIEPMLDTHTSHCFEELCRDWLRARAVDYDAARVGRQWSRHYEIDLAAANVQDQLTVVGECKWSNRKVGLSVLRDLEATVRDNRLPLAPGCVRLLCSRAGFTKALRNQAATDPTLTLLSPATLFQAP